MDQSLLALRFRLSLLPPLPSPFSLFPRTHTALSRTFCTHGHSSKEKNREGVENEQSTMNLRKSFGEMGGGLERAIKTWKLSFRPGVGGWSTIRRHREGFLKKSRNAHSPRFPPFFTLPPTYFPLFLGNVHFSSFPDLCLHSRECKKKTPFNAKKGSSVCPEYISVLSPAFSGPWIMCHILFFWLATVRSADLFIFFASESRGKTRVVVVRPLCRVLLRCSCYFSCLFFWDKSLCIAEEERKIIGMCCFIFTRFEMKQMQITLKCKSSRPMKV